MDPSSRCGPCQFPEKTKVSWDRSAPQAGPGENKRMSALKLGAFAAIHAELASHQLGNDLLQNGGGHREVGREQRRWRCAVLMQRRGSLRPCLQDETPTSARKVTARKFSFLR